MLFGEPNFGGIMLLVAMAIVALLLGRLVPGRRALAAEVAIASVAAFTGLLLSWVVDEGPAIGGLNLIPAALGLFGTFFALRIFEYLIYSEELPYRTQRVYARGRRAPPVRGRAEEPFSGSDRVYP